MIPDRKLPYTSAHSTVEEYVENLLRFITSSDMLQTLCGGIHVLDFLIGEPDLYETVLPLEWREWLSGLDVSDILDLLMRENLNPLLNQFPCEQTPREFLTIDDYVKSEDVGWRGKKAPPYHLLQYIRNIRSLTLDHTYTPTRNISNTPSLSRRLSVGMSIKKAHEVANYAAFLDDLSSQIANTYPHRITHIIDFGSGQNYLGRTLASPAYSKDVVAIESRRSNIDGAKVMDVMASLAKKEIIMRNKKAFRSRAKEATEGGDKRNQSGGIQDRNVGDGLNKPPKTISTEESKVKGGGKIKYVEYRILNGDLSSIIEPYLNSEDKKEDDNTSYVADHTAEAPGSPNGTQQTVKSVDLNGDSSSVPTNPEFMVVSLHSCGNLIHHGLRSLILNHSVKAVAMVGCCYNLVTERLGPWTYKLPVLRPPNARLTQTSSAYDSHGFPMSERLASYHHQGGLGIRMNITARMMAVQAPRNWTKADCDSFFTRHFYRALLQRIFLDRGIVEHPQLADDVMGGASPRGWSGGGQPIILGSLRKSCYASFIAYVHGAIAKLVDGAEQGSWIKDCLADLTDDEIMEYEKKYQGKRHELSVIWSLMAFSAGVLESAIVVDRWLWLKEQDEVADCWVQSVFDHKQSPRNLVVTGIKR